MVIFHNRRGFSQLLGVEDSRRPHAFKRKPRQIVPLPDAENYGLKAFFGDKERGRPGLGVWNSKTGELVGKWDFDGMLDGGKTLPTRL